MKATLVLLVIAALAAIAYSAPVEESNLDPVQIVSDGEDLNRKARQFGFGFGGVGFGGGLGYRPYGYGGYGRYYGGYRPYGYGGYRPYGYGGFGYYG